MAVSDNWLISEVEIDQFLAFILKYKGMDLRSYKKSFISRRLKARLDAHRFDSVAKYVQLIRRDDSEWRAFLNNLCINVSEFFRDQDVFLVFKEVCVPELVRRKQAGRVRYIRCWSCGCSCGEEAYSIAITFKEVLKHRIKDFTIKIWATDIDEEALEKARRGEYSKETLSKIPPVFLDKYFEEVNEGICRVKEEIRDLVLFQKQNLFYDPPLTNMDVVFLRNVRIYFSGIEAESVLLRAYLSLKKGGYLILGKVETLGSLRSYFEPVSLRSKIFLRSK